jgi:hypothetical protein
MAPNGRSIIGLFVGLALVVAFAVARLRLPKFPLHPVMFLAWNTWTAGEIASAFLFGWLIKVGIVKYSGNAGYQKGKPFMFGVIAGSLLASLFPALIGLVYYQITGEIPK